MPGNKHISAIVAVVIGGLLALPFASIAEEPAAKGLAKQIFQTMIAVHGVTSGFRPVHAKGIVCQGTFKASVDAAGLSKAAHFQSSTVPITVRFSDGAPNPIIPDNSPNAGPRGMAIRFLLPHDEQVDIVAMSHNGFVVGTGEDFLELQKSIVATDPSTPHPWAVEKFLGSHPLALKFLQENQIPPASFATQPFFSNDSFIFVNKDGLRRAGRYKIVPAAGTHLLSPDEAKTKAPNFLIDDLKTRLESEPVQYRVVVQLPNEGDVTKDPSLVWPDDRKEIEVGTISVKGVVADSAAAEKLLAFDPTTLTDGIELSDDPFPRL